MATRNRRQFLEESMLAAATAVTTSSAAQFLVHEPVPSRSAIEQLGVAVVGVRGRGNSHLGFFAGRRDTRVLYVCDVDRRVGQERVGQVADRQGGYRPEFEEDIRKVLDDPRVDIVSVATPNHWHALCSIWAMQAGKDVYVEKPVSHNIQEGRRMVEASRRYQRICQSGMQARSNPGMIAAIDYVRRGKIGSVRLARGVCYKRRESVVLGGTYPIPADINYHLWLGPAPAAPLVRKRFHYDWHWQWPYGNGELGNQGVHQMDLCRWGLGRPGISRSVLSFGGAFGAATSGQMTDTQVVFHDYGDRSIVLETRGLASRGYRGTQVGVIFEGTDGFVVLASYRRGAAFDAEGREVMQFRGVGGNELHFGNFLKAVRSRNCCQLTADIEEGHISSALCHAGNISYRLGTDISFSDAAEQLAGCAAGTDLVSTLAHTQEHLRGHGVPTDSVPLRLGAALDCDPVHETFRNNQKANWLCTRLYRRPFVVPAAGSV